ncbi:sugar phosphate nucleotidyltransferase [Halolamina litorea]|uniref:Bifunctional protein GlmU n=1 Tax=Halolamina litorea TaxID=1515593 RepID=A0ABD6BWP2_9EURY|nr:bifunctional sugar-1-phosphate nucleotidylyltransferase/acetyltransferase [Halolamina litorea]
MQTVVLAAGEGSRMGALTEETPKPCLPVAGRPLVAHTLDAAVAAGASRFVVVVGCGAEQVRTALGDRHAGVPIEYCRQDEQRGTADAVLAARSQLVDAPFVVLNGDALYDTPSLSRVYDAVPSVGSYVAEDPTQYGVLTLEDGAPADAGNYEQALSWDGGSGAGRVVGVTEKPADPESNLVNAGAYTFPSRARDALDGIDESERGEFELTDLLEDLCRSGHVEAVPFARWIDVGRPWELLAANEWKLDELTTRVDGDVAAGATLDGPVVVESGATVHDGVTIEGPALIGAGASVGPNAFIRGATLVGPDAHIGHAVEIKNSVIGEGTNVAHLSYVGDSLLADDVNLGAGTVVANLRHDDAPVKLTVKGQRRSTGRRKFGAVIGRGVKTGINTSIDAGVTLSPSSQTGLGEAVTRDR